MGTVPGQPFLSELRLIDVTNTLLGAFLETERMPGYLASLTDSEREQALAVLRPEVPSIAAALAYVAVRPAVRWHDYIFTLQPALRLGVESGVIQATDDAAKMAGTLLNSPVRRDTLQQRLRWALEYIDDGHWCEITARKLGLAGVSFRAANVHPRFPIQVDFVGVSEPLYDARLVPLVREAMDYRRLDGVSLTVMPAGRISIAIGDPARANVGGVSYVSDQTVTRELLERLEASGSGWEAITRVRIAQVS